MVLSPTNRALKGKEGKKWAIESQLKMRYEGGEGYMRDTCMAGLKPAHLEYRPSHTLRCYTFTTECT